MFEAPVGCPIYILIFFNTSGSGYKFFYAKFPFCIEIYRNSHKTSLNILFYIVKHSERNEQLLNKVLGHICTY